MADKFYTTGQAAKAIGVSRQTLHTWIAEGKVKAPKMIGNTRVWNDLEVAKLRRVPRRPRQKHKPRRK